MDTYSTMNKERIGASNVIGKEAMLVLGGQDKSNIYLNSTEWINESRTTAGPSLPEPRAWHCSLLITNEKN